MTSDQIKAYFQPNNDGGVFLDPGHSDFWLTEIAYQLAVMNERNAEREAEKRYVQGFEMGEKFAERLGSTVPPGSESALREEWTDWTVKDGRSNSSDTYNHLSAEVGKIIRNSSADLMAGRSDLVGGLIVAHLAHECHIQPAGGPPTPDPADSPNSTSEK
jgi:hypothetical protein